MVQNSDPSLCIIGAGRVGSVLAYHFSRFNIPLSGIIERNEASHSVLRATFPHIEIFSSPSAEAVSRASIVFICVPDDQLAGMVKNIQRLGIDLSGTALVHTSGVYSSEILTPLKGSNGHIASAHPIYSFGQNDPAKTSLEGVFFDLEGDVLAVDNLKKLFQKTGIKSIEITPEQKIAVHLASVFYSNYFVGLSHIAREVLRASDFPEEHFSEIFIPLMESTLTNISSETPANALTGPIKRGDVLTVEKHLTYLKSYYSDAVSAYIQMARILLQISGLTDEKRRKLENVLANFESKD